MKKRPKINIKIGFLNQLNDSVEISCFSDNTVFYNLIKDQLTMGIRNVIQLPISENDFNVMFQLSGSKTLIIQRYLIPSKKNEIVILNLEITLKFIYFFL